MRVIDSLYVIFAALMAAAAVWANEGKLVHLVSFSDYESGPVEDWPQGNGFQYKEDAKRRDRIDLDVGEKCFVLEAKSRAFGVTTGYIILTKAHTSRRAATMCE